MKGFHQFAGWRISAPTQTLCYSLKIGEHTQTWQCGGKCMFPLFLSERSCSLARSFPQRPVYDLRNISNKTTVFRRRRQPHILHTQTLASFRNRWILRQSPASLRAAENTIGTPCLYSQSFSSCGKCDAYKASPLDAACDAGQVSCWNGLLWHHAEEPLRWPSLPGKDTRQQINSV